MIKDILIPVSLDRDANTIRKSCVLKFHVSFAFDDGKINTLENCFEVLEKQLKDIEEGLSGKRI